MILWGILLAFEILLLAVAQRRAAVAWDIHLPRPIAILLIAPGTILHELAHLVMAVLMGSRIGKVRLFYPQKLPDGSMSYGYVEHATAGILRPALIAIAPVLLVPVFLLGIGWGLLGTLDPEKALEADIWRIGLWMLILLLGSRAAFPSIGDHIGFLGGLSLAVLFSLIVIWLSKQELLETALQNASIVLLPAAAAAAILVISSHRR